MTLAISVGLLMAGGIYLLLQRGMLRIVLGFVLLSHGVNLILMAAGGTSRRGEPLGQGLDPDTTADPLPQAFVLTAIVIAFAITIYMLALAATGKDDDDTYDEPPEQTSGRSPLDDSEFDDGAARSEASDRPPANGNDEHRRGGVA